MKIYTPRYLLHLYRTWKTLRSLESKGMMFSYIDDAGERRWDRTPLGEAVADIMPRADDVRS